MITRHLTRPGIVFMALLSFALSSTLPVISIAQDSPDAPEKLTHWLTPEEMTRLDEIGMAFVETDPPASPIRNVAEFDHMQGVLVRYPFGIPVALIKEMAEDEIMVTTIVNSTSQQNLVINLYVSNGVDTSHCNFLIAGTNSYWTRDYGPWFESDSANQIGIIDFPYNRPRPLDDEIPKKVADMLGIPWFGMNLIHTGGNYMTDGYGNSASTTLVWEENPLLTHEQVAEKVLDYLGIEEYHVVPDPNGTYIDHIDCWAKFMAPDKILVRSVPPSHPRYTYIELAAAYWATQTCAYGYNYQVYRTYTPNNQPYTNSMILNKKVLVPIMNSIWDDSALSVYQAAMPGYEVIGIIGNPSTPWEPTDALHCRAKGIADVGLLYIRHYPLYGEYPCEENYVIDAELIVCSDTTVINDSVLIHYRVNGGSWLTTNMVNTSGSFYSGIIPKQPGENTIDYCLTAADHSGRHANAPYIGEPDPFQFNTVYTNITAIPDTLWFLTLEDCLYGKVTMLHNYTMGPIMINFIETEGYTSDFSWFVTDPPVCPYTIASGGTDSIRVIIPLPVLDNSGIFVFDTLTIITSVDTIHVIIMVDDSLLITSTPDLTQIPDHLGHCYPNPVSDQTVIPFTLSADGGVILEVVDMDGKVVRTLLDANLLQGVHQVSWNGTNVRGQKVPGGVYIYRLKTTRSVQAHRMVVIR
ncbi:MAG: agmatine deiminase family protein [Bacteroidota bacterium]